ncbi:ThuA domain-containing protein [Urbifossiella limnaea]|uniref:Trehalose utilization n=1 Tax=Urbifossiella limnaea TaxID=2528023 RepID=A0A517XZ86_9BACT|nr:ThuA domain-containing protein [Urbifossiella limnaea]QDU22817.1 Trehalose utilization [Urbifossiella limnaea]
MTPARRWLALLVAALASGPVAAAEPWADAKLPVAGGLELWLDAARASASTPPPHDGKLETWYDASGKGRHLRQPVADARPTRLPAGGAAVVRFDGLDDHLRAVKQAAELDTFTVFVVAAPRANPGGFRGVLAFNNANQRDYESGLCLDHGPNPSVKFNSLNVEGRGFGGWKNLLKGEQPLGELTTLEVTGEAKALRLTVNGTPAGARPRDGAPVSLDEITVGARYYTNGPGPQKVDSLGRWDVAEVLVYNRVLPAAEAKAVRDYLSAKHAALKQQLPPDGSGGAPLVLVKDPPPVQMFLPGFTVRELPVDLTNINNVLYRPDGSLIALGYNGNLYALRDADGDGVEERAELIWDAKGSLRGPLGIAFLPNGRGTLVPSKGRLTLVTDDGKATTIASGWPEIFPAVDTLGVAVDPRDGAVYFGRGCANFTDPYQRDKAGKAAYKLTDETGTIQRLSPDFKTREIVATGVRFPVALRFNKLGDLFATDQEGATWAPNGNPLDELLHIQKGRHYGFPSRHPKHLPAVTDEPSTFDYGPQHQSTCGFCFNEPVTAGGPTFGPKHWAGDAIVTGESRGKLYRTKLVKTPSGYVAGTQLIAALNMLVVDCCVAPDGSLVVACHGGGPDWGSGPTGKGKLFKISYTDRDHPQPVLVWPAGPREVRVEFDRPVDPALLRDVLKGTTLTAGRYVRAGDRFESMWPGYAVVHMQKAAPRVDIPVRSAQLTPDRRTLVLATDALPAAVHYALTLPGMGRPAEPPKGTLRQLPAIDLGFDLCGCEATFTPSVGTRWRGWLPHPDLQVSQSLTAGSAPHDVLWAQTAKTGVLTLKAKLDLADMLRPAVQPGSQLDHEPPPEEVTVATHRGLKTLYVGPTAPVPFDLEVGGNISTGIHFTTKQSTKQSPQPRPLQLHRFILPWANTDSKALGREVVAARAPELDGGSWARGRAEFFGEQAACAKCHAVQGRGGDLGPDLSNLVHRDYASVLRDIENPSFAVNPDHIASVVQLTDGRTLTGVVRTAGDKLRVGDEKGTITEVAKADVEKLTAAPKSIMPEGLPKQLGPDRMRDLMTFLLTPPPRMPDYGPTRPPEPRTRADVAAVLAGAPVPPLPTRPITVVLVSGKKDHGPGEHDYPAWAKAWKELLGVAEKTTVDTAEEWPTAAQLKAADVLVFYQRGSWTAERAKDMDAFLARGGGAVYVHWAVEGGPEAPAFAQRIGLASNAAGLRFRHGPLELGFDTGARHPVGRNFDKLKLHDESYWQMTGDPKRITLLASGKEDGADRPLFWTLEPAKGRVVVSIPGHFAWTFDDPLFRVLLLRGIAWAAREPVDRFNDLATPGARVRD